MISMDPKKNVNLDHVVQRLLIAQTEAFPDVQHVYFSTGHHDPDQRVISCAQTLEKNKKHKYMFVLYMHTHSNVYT